MYCSLFRFSFFMQIYMHKQTKKKLSRINAIWELKWSNFKMPGSGLPPKFLRAPEPKKGSGLQSVKWSGSRLQSRNFRAPGPPFETLGTASGLRWLSRGSALLVYYPKCSTYLWVPLIQMLKCRMQMHKHIFVACSWYEGNAVWSRQVKKAGRFGNDCIRWRIHYFEQSMTRKLHVLCTGTLTSNCERNQNFTRRTESELSEIPLGKL